MSIPVPLHGFASGGAMLNFKIANYATEDSLLADKPAENTLGVITDVKISSWLFASTEPSQPTEGMVWVYTNTSSLVEFNAFKKNGIQICPRSVKQFVSGSFVLMDAFLYQSGSWVQFSYTRLYLYKNGDRNLELTGDYHRDNSTGKVVSEKTVDGIVCLNFPCASDLYAAVASYTGKMIDVTAHDYLVERSTHGRSGDVVHLVDADGNVVAKSETAKDRGSEMQTLIVDVSKLTGEYYIRFYNFNNGYDHWEMYELYLSDSYEEDV